MSFVSSTGPISRFNVSNVTTDRAETDISSSSCELSAAIETEANKLNAILDDRSICAADYTSDELQAILNEPGLESFEDALYQDASEYIKETFPSATALFNKLLSKVTN